MNKSYKFDNNIQIFRTKYSSGESRESIGNRIFVITNVKECYFASDIYFVLYEECYYTIITPRIPEFEAIFPEFPYCRETYGFNKLEQKLLKLISALIKLLAI